VALTHSDTRRDTVVAERDVQKTNFLRISLNASFIKNFVVCSAFCCRYFHFWSPKQKQNETKTKKTFQKTIRDERSDDDGVALLGVVAREVKATTISLSASSCFMTRLCSLLGVEKMRQECNCRCHARVSTRVINEFVVAFVDRTKAPSRRWCCTTIRSRCMRR
jgi:hypothetical protein